VAGAAAFAGTAQAQGTHELNILPGPWLSVGVGGATVKSLAPSPAAGLEGVAGSIEVGYRFTPEWGVGLDFGAIAPVGGCAYWDCASPPQEFAPNFTRVFAFGEFRPRDSGWRFRASAGVSRFCYSRYWSDSAWNWGDFAMMLLDEDYLADTIGGSGAYRCDGRTRAMGGSLMVGYDWAVTPKAPVSIGVRLTAEAANFGATDQIGVPAFRHRAVTLSLHLNLN
jgi:hypothetical protein